MPIGDQSSTTVAHIVPVEKGYLTNKWEFIVIFQSFTPWSITIQGYLCFDAKNPAVILRTWILATPQKQSFRTYPKTCEKIKVIGSTISKLRVSKTSNIFDPRKFNTTFGSECWGLNDTEFEVVRVENATIINQLWTAAMHISFRAVLTMCYWEVFANCEKTLYLSLKCKSSVIEY